MYFLGLIVLGIIQGITEFLPISSTSHLILANRAFQVMDSSHLYLLNIGSLAALIWLMRSHLKMLYKETFEKKNRQIILKLGVTVLPAIVFGGLSFSLVDDLSSNMAVMAVALILFGVLMLKRPPKAKLKSFHDITWKMAIVMGLVQSLSIIPGTSRLAVTLLAGLWLGLSPRLAFHWSFLMAIPILALSILATVFDIDTVYYISRNLPGIFVANLFTFVISLLVFGLALRLFLDYGLKYFGVYRIALGSLVLILVAVNIL